MKAILIIGMVVALLAVTLPADAVDWSNMAPSETQEVDTSSPSVKAAPLKPRIIPSETQTVDTTSPSWVAVKSPRENWKIEELVPSETQEVEESATH